MMRMIAAVFMLFAVPALAAPAPPGSVVLSLQHLNSAITPTVDAVRMDIYSENGSFIRTLVSTSLPPFWSLITADAQNVIYAGMQNITPPCCDLSKVSDQGAIIPWANVPISPDNSMAADRAGNIYIATYGGFQKVSPSGQIGPTFLTAFYGPKRGMDIAADQCTIYYSSAGISRYNVCAATDVPALVPALPVQSPGDIRILPSGQTLVADATAGVLLLDSVGNIQRTYAGPALYLALAPDAKSFWEGYGSHAQRVEIATGAVLATIDSDSSIAGVIVVNEPRVAFAQPIPQFQAIILALLGIILVVVAMKKLI